MKHTHTPEEIMRRLAELPKSIKPEDGQRYWYATSDCRACYYEWHDGYTDKRMLDCGNCFATEEDAKKHADFRKWLFAPSKLTLEECWQNAVDIYTTMPRADLQAAESFLKLAKENGHV